MSSTERMTKCRVSDVPCSDAMLCHAMLGYDVLCSAMLCHALPCSAMPCYAMLCHAMLCLQRRGRRLLEERREQSLERSCRVGVENVRYVCVNRPSSRPSSAPSAESAHAITDDSGAARSAPAANPSQPVRSVTSSWSANVSSSASSGVGTYIA